MTRRSPYGLRVQPLDVESKSVETGNASADVRHPITTTNKENNTMTTSIFESVKPQFTAEQIAAWKEAVNQSLTDAGYFVTDKGSELVRIAGVDRPLFFARDPRPGKDNALFLVSLSTRKGAKNLGEIIDTHMIKATMNYLAELDRGGWGYQETGLMLKQTPEQLHVNSGVGSGIKNVGLVRAWYASGTKDHMFIKGMEQLRAAETEDVGLDVIVGTLDYINGRLSVSKVNVYKKGEFGAPFTAEVKEENHERNVVCKAVAADWIFAGNGMTLKPVFKETKSKLTGEIRTHAMHVNAYLSHFLAAFKADENTAYEMANASISKTVGRQALGAGYAKLNAAKAEAKATGTKITPIAEVRVFNSSSKKETFKEEKKGHGIKALLGKKVVYTQGNYVISDVLICNEDVLALVAAANDIRNKGTDDYNPSLSIKLAE